MKGSLKLLLVVVAGLMAGVFIEKCQSPQNKTGELHGCVADTLKVFDTICYKSPGARSELAIGTRRYSLPNYNFIGVGSGGEPRCINTNDTTTAVDNLTLVTYYGTGAGGEPRSIGDSAILELPIIQRHYADSTYEAWVSGPIAPQLDSVRVFVPTTLITKREWKPPKRWHIGPTIGYGYTPQGFEPYIGISIMYSIISF